MQYGGIIWFVLAILVGIAASNKGRSGIIFFLVSALLSPLVGFIILLVIGDKNKLSPEWVNMEVKKDTTRNENIITTDKVENNNVVIQSNIKKCPFCAENIKKEAIICRFCNRDLQ